QDRGDEGGADPGERVGNEVAPEGGRLHQCGYEGEWFLRRVTGRGRSGHRDHTPPSQPGRQASPPFTAVGFGADVDTEGDRLMGRPPRFSEVSGAEMGFVPHQIGCTAKAELLD